MLLDGKTKQLVRRDPLSLLRRWETVPLRGVDILKTWGSSLHLTLHGQPMVLHADDAVLHAISNALLQRTSHLSRLPADERLPPREEEDDVDLQLFEPPEATPVNSPQHSPSTTPRASPPPISAARPARPAKSIGCSCPPCPVSASPELRLDIMLLCP